MQKRQDDREGIVKQLSEGRSHEDTRTTESIDDVKEVALSCETMIKEFKV